MDNFNCDPLGGHAMLQTAENVAKKHGIGTAEQHELVLRREEQYRMSLENDSAFLKRFMTLPFDVPAPNFKKAAGSMAGDEGISHSTAEGLAKLKPVMAGGSVTFGGQTHPADGNAAIVVTTAKGARTLHRQEDRGAPARLRPGPRAGGLHARGHGAGGAARAGSGRQDDCRDEGDQDPQPLRGERPLLRPQTGCDLKNMNNYGCSLVWGHPQAPMGTRAIIELIEELALKGGGFGLFTGCAAGDTAMSVVLEVGDAR
jgi:acetyl-CoA acetyltransferase